MGPVAKAVVEELGEQGGVVRPSDPPPLRENDPIPDAHQAWESTLLLLFEGGAALLGLQALSDTAAQIQATRDAYRPGPDGPIYDSMFATWWAIDLPVQRSGEADQPGESIASIIADVGESVGGSPEQTRRMRSLADCRLQVVRIVARKGLRVELEDLVTGDHASVTLSHDAEGEAGDLWLVRLLPPLLPDGEHVCILTPYLLTGPDAETQWRAYFRRVLGRSAKKRYPAHMRGDPPSYWLDFVMEAASDDGELNAHLEGLPREEGLTELEQARERLLVELVDSGRLAAACEDFDRARDALGLEPLDGEEEPLLPLTFAYGLYGLREGDGTTLLEEILSRKGNADAVPKEDRTELLAVKAGWFSVFEVEDVKAARLEVKDLLRRRKLELRDPDAGEAEPGDLIAGWVADKSGVLTLEGASCRIRSTDADLAKSLLDRAHQQVKEEQKGLHWKKRLGLMPPAVGAIAALLV